MAEEAEKEFTILRKIDIFDHNPTAVKALFDHIEGFSSLLNDCKSFELLGDMLLLCDFYMMPQPENLIVEKLKNTTLTTENFASAFETGKKLEMSQRLKPVADYLLRRSLNFVGTNLASFQNILNLVASNSNHSNAVLAMIRLLGESGEFVLR